MAVSTRALEARELGIERGRETRERSELGFAKRIETELKIFLEKIEGLQVSLNVEDHQLKLFGGSVYAPRLREFAQRASQLLAFANLIYRNAEAVINSAVSELRTEQQEMAAEMRSADRSSKPKILSLLRSVMGRDIHTIREEITLMQNFVAKLRAVFDTLKRGEEALAAGQIGQASNQVADARVTLGVYAIPELRPLRRLIKTDIAYTREEEAIFRRMESM